MRRMEAWRKAAQWLLAPEPATSGKYAGHLAPRWIFLRGLGLIYFSAFYPLLFQIKGLIGPEGILPANKFVEVLEKYNSGFERFWIAPTLFWFSQENWMLMLVCWLGLLASVAVIFNLWPRAALLICLICYLAFVAAAQGFSGYQSDGMLLEAGFISLFFAPPGLRPGLAESHRPTRASLFLLRWEWFRIYFRIRCGQDCQWGLLMASPHRHGRLLPELPTAFLDRLVCAASSALVPRIRVTFDFVC